MTQERVWIPNNAGHDYSAVGQYGNVVFLTEGVVQKYDVPRLYREFVSKMQGAQPDDYVVITGLPILNVIAASIQIKRYGRLNCLLYRGGRYIEHTVAVT